MCIQFGFYFVLLWLLICEAFELGILPHPRSFALVLLYSFLILLAAIIILPLIVAIIATICEGIYRAQKALRKRFVRIKSYRTLHVPIDSAAAAIYEIRFSNGQVITPRVYYMKRKGEYKAYLPEEEKSDPDKELLFEVFYDRILKLPSIASENPGKEEAGGPQRVKYLP
jgi:hypothetical protein